MIIVRLLALATATACFAPSYGDGQIPCGPAGECPADLTCAADRKCWHTGKEPQACPTGYSRAGDGTCADVDECQAGAATCDAHATCTNTPGAYTCACKPGWSGNGKTCADVDECQAGTAGCDANATCTNSPGAYSCACKLGWTGDGKTCAPFFDRVASAADHGCALRADGALFCWGDNSVGQLGAGAAQASVRAPIRIGTALWTEIAVAGFTSCGIQSDASLWCWGDDGCGAIGDGNTGNCRGTIAVPLPYPTGGASRWTHVSLAATHACAVQSDGSLWCWGRNVAGDLGTNDADDHLVPTRVGADLGWEAVAAGGAHTCGLRAGELWCWGTNASGQLGDGGLADTSPVPKRIGTGSAWRALAAGDQHSCGLLSDQTLACWGAGDHGQLGNGVAGAGLIVQAPAVVPGGALWAAVAAGAQETCARTATGGLFCFGANAFGQLGDGSFIDRSSPAPVAGSDWAALAVGGATACATKTGGQIWCWGKNDLGALGLGTGGDATTPKHTVAGTYAQLSFGAFHACGIKADKSLWCWGDNSHGQLGLATTGGGRDVPTAVSGGGSWLVVAAGTDSTCAVQVGGALYCWGGNVFGQLGVGTSGLDAGMDLPTRVPDPGAAPAVWSQVSVRGTHACAIQSDGSLWCWGFGGNGQLGIGPTMGNVVLPAPVAGGGSWSAVAAGDGHTCGIEAGALRCWGQNDSGQLGVGTDLSTRTAPTSVGPETDWTAISAGAAHTCGLRGSSLYCWGYNYLGEIGNGGSGVGANAYVPDLIPGVWVAVDAGDYTTCAVTNLGGLTCWGSNGNGLVGDPTAGDVATLPRTIGTGFTAVGLASQAACALEISGGLSCWGHDADGLFGDDTTFYETPARVMDPD